MDKHEQASLDLVTDHPFKPGRWGDVCTHVGPHGFPCGYAEAEHAQSARKVPLGGDAIEP
jgi:hypothetical protein